MEELFRKVGIGVREFVPAEQAIEGVSLQTAWNRALRKLLSPLPAPRWVWTTTLVVVGVGLGLVLGSFLSPWIQDSSQRGIEESRLEQLLKAEGIDLTDFDLTKAKSYTVQEETNTLREIAAQEYKDERYWIVLYILNYSRLQHLRAPAEVELPPGTPLILVEKK